MSRAPLASLAFAVLFALVIPSLAAAGNKDVVKYCRFQAGKTVAYGIVEGDRVRQLDGDLYGDFKKTDKTYPLKEVKLLVPAKPTQVLALAGNYKSHLNDNNSVTTVTTVTKLTTNGKTGETKSESKTLTETAVAGDIPEKFKIPQPFFKSPSCLVADGENIVLPKDSKVVHYEAELVIVIGKKAKNVSKEKALDYVLGVTCGNDVSERAWQNGDAKDVQWWRAKGADTFGPVGPVIVSGLDYDDLLLTLRLNGEVKQKERTSLFIQDVPSTVSFISRYITLHPGDMIFTGTPGRTSEIKAGDVVEVELEGVGILRNPVVAE
jgi:2-keto-4-pentenoate hydratase/2-oxohepta-3-ene-1,7-dioic acid hydratase in catechol pathway